MSKSPKHPVSEQWMVGPGGEEMSLDDLMKTYPKGTNKAHFSNVHDPVVNKLYGIKEGSGSVNHEAFGGDVFMSVDGTFGIRIIVPKEIEL